MNKISLNKEEYVQLPKKLVNYRSSKVTTSKEHIIC